MAHLQYTMPKVLLELAPRYLGLLVWVTDQPSWWTLDTALSQL